MASSRITTSLVVYVIERKRPNFKKHPYKSVEDDPSGTFSSVANRVLNVEDIRAYIHCNIDELGSAQMLKLYTQHMIDGMGNLKLEFKLIEEKGFTQFIKFLVFDEPEWVRYILSRMHDEFMWLDKPHKITKSAIKAVTCLSLVDEVPTLRNVKIQKVTKVISS